ncbi:MAG: ABC transporter permease subunit [Chloroflexota bacterium]|nr:ABC transporter permease subunit [Chloroflexota bacterium]
MSRILAIFGREMLELRLNRTFFQTMALFPILMVGLPVAAIIFFSIAVNGVINSTSIANGITSEGGGIAGGSTAEILGSIVVICLSFFLPVPMVLPMTIASYSVVGEKEKKSLEPLLVTPIKTSELLTGKALSAVVPTVLLCWGSFIALLFIIRLVLSEEVLKTIDVGVWVFTVLSWTPLLAIMTALAGIMLSSRARDARAAQQTGSLMVIPILILVLGLAFGFIKINWLWCLGGMVSGLVLDIVLYQLALKIFERENILTRWK